MLLNQRDRRIRLLHTATGLMVALASQQAMAGAFQLREQNTSYLGTAYSGTASTAEDCSTNFYNPAGLTELRHNQVVVSGVYYKGHLTMNDAVGLKATGLPVMANPKVKPASEALIPALHASARINSKWSVGISAVAPFGLSTRYQGDSVVRFVSTKSAIATTDITPSVAFKFNEKFSLGVGFDAMYLKATLASQVATGAATEGNLTNKGDSWAYGFHVGVLFSPSCCTQMGLTYFSQFDTTVKGDTTPTAIPTLVNRNSFRARVHLPDRFVYSITHKYSQKWTAVADVEWVHWSRLKDLTLVYNDGGMSRYSLQYQNSWRFALGGYYTASDCWKIKLGLAWDQSPVQNAYRKINLPDSNKFWLAIGAKYQWKKNLAVDIAYAHLRANKCSVFERAPNPATATAAGNYKNSANLLGVQLTWSMM